MNIYGLDRKILWSTLRIAIEDINRINGQNRFRNQIILEAVSRSEEFNGLSKEDANAIVRAPISKSEDRLHKVAVYVVEALMDKLSLEPSEREALVDRATAIADPMYGQQLVDEYSEASPPAESVPTASPRNVVEDFLEGAAIQLGMKPGSPDQGRLREVAGRYFIIRHLSTRAQFAVSHMQIYLPRSSSLPTWFKTIGDSTHRSLDARNVRGIAFIPDGHPDQIVTIGRIEGQMNTRMAIVTRVGPNRLKANALYGLRISQGTVLNMQIACRIWCARIDKANLEWRSFIGNYDEAKLLDTFTPYVDGLQDVMAWLREEPTLGRDQYPKHLGP